MFWELQANKVSVQTLMLCVYTEIKWLHFEPHSESFQHVNLAGSRQRVKVQELFGVELKKKVSRGGEVFNSTPENLLKSSDEAPEPPPTLLTPPGRSTVGRCGGAPARTERQCCSPRGAGASGTPPRSGIPLAGHCRRGVT